MRKIHVLVVAYERDISLGILISSFILQTNPNWVLYIVHDGKAPKKVMKIINSYSDHRVMFIETDKHNGHHGHINRGIYLQKLPTCDDFVLLTNDDNYYVPEFVERMLYEASNDIGIVYCDTVHSHYEYNTNFSVLRENGIDMGAFIVRLDIAKKVGFNYTHFSADGKYAEECHKECTRNNLRVIRIPKCLFVHN